MHVCAYERKRPHVRSYFESNETKPNNERKGNKSVKRTKNRGTKKTVTAILEN